MKRSAQSGWTKTKKTLDPSRLMERREKPVVRPANTATESGFFSSLFGREENKEIRTVNDFLSQPQPR